MPALERTTMMAKPYSFFFHPLVTFVDKLLQIVVCFLTPIYLLGRYAQAKDTKRLLSRLASVRAATKGLEDSGASLAISAWGKALECEIVEHEFTISREHGILLNWGILDDKKQLEDINDRKNLPTHVKIVFRFPARLLNQKTEIGETKNKSGTVLLKELDVETLLESNKTVPLIIHYHGGGFTMGVASDSVGVDFVHRPSKEASRSVILASVEYHFAPEFPFPTTVEDAIQGMSYFINILLKLHQNKVETIPLHVSGGSAGGNLAAVVAMETHRRYPGMLKSALVMCPMFDPAADSLSYYLNSKSSWMVTVPWLRWCWKEYLQLNDDDEVETHPRKNWNDLSLEERLAFQSNRKAWANSKWKGTTYERLINPVSSLPPNGLTDETLAPKVLVTTQEADPLRDDGVVLVKALRAAGMSTNNLKHVQTNGSHHLGLMVDTESIEKITSWWGEIMFGTHKSN